MAILPRTRFATRRRSGAPCRSYKAGGVYGAASRSRLPFLLLVFSFLHPIPAMRRRVFAGVDLVRFFFHRCGRLWNPGGGRGRRRPAWMHPTFTSTHGRVDGAWRTTNRCWLHRLGTTIPHWPLLVTPRGRRAKGAAEGSPSRGRLHRGFHVVFSFGVVFFLFSLLLSHFTTKGKTRKKVFRPARSTMRAHGELQK